MRLAQGYLAPFLSFRAKDRKMGESCRAMLQKLNAVCVARRH